MASPAPVVVVGGGTAGCTVVAYLASHTNRDIVLVEPGGLATSDDEPRFYEALSHHGVTRSRTVRVSHKRDAPYLEGRALGGGSAINGMLLTGDVPGHLRGLTRMATKDDSGPMGQMLLKAGGEFSRLWWNGGRWNPGRAVKHLVEEGRVRVVSGEVQLMRFQGSRVVSVQTGAIEVECSHVVLCAGAIATPELLLRSGCGEVNSAIGVELMNHPSITVPFSLDEESHARFDASVILRRTVAESGEIQMFAFERASKTDVRLGLISVALMNPNSFGNVRLIDDDCSIDFNALHTQRDQEFLTAGVEALLDALTFAGAPTGVHLAEPVAGHFSFRDFGDADSLGRLSMVAEHVELLSHASSSCTKAVDSKGNLLGYHGVTLADASVLALPNCTPAAPVTMGALRISQILGKELS